MDCAWKLLFFKTSILCSSTETHLGMLGTLSLIAKAEKQYLSLLTTFPVWVSIAFPQLNQLTSKNMKKFYWTTAVVSTSSFPRYCVFIANNSWWELPHQKNPELPGFFGVEKVSNFSQKGGINYFNTNPF